MHTELTPEQSKNLDEACKQAREVLASAEQVAALQTTAQPVFDKLQENSFNAESIAAIRELKAKTQPSAGAHGELTGALIIRAYHKYCGELKDRDEIIVPDSAHGTNPASACGPDLQALWHGQPA